MNDNYDEDIAGDLSSTEEDTTPIFSGFSNIEDLPTTIAGLGSVNPVTAINMGKERLRQLTELKARMKAQALARQAAMERVAQLYQTPIDTGMDPGLIALGRGVASRPPSQGLIGFMEGAQGMQEARQKLAERDWARKAAAERVRAQSEQQNMSDILNEGKLDSAMLGVSRFNVPHIREYTNEKGERVQVSTDPNTGETKQAILGKTQGRAGEIAKLKAGFQWAKNSDGTPKLDENGLPMQAKIETLPTGTIPGSASSGEIPEKGWKFYTDGTSTFRGNPNAPNGGFQKQTENGWEPTTSVPQNLKNLGANSGQSSALNQRFAGRVIGASNEGLAALSTIAGMGDPSTDLFGVTKNPMSIFAKGVLSPEQSKRYNATIAGLSVEIATAQNQGMVPNQEQIKHVQDAITIQPTDDETTKKYRVALAARYFDKALETSKDLANDKQSVTIEKIRGQLKEFPDPNSLLNLKPEKHMFTGEKAMSKDSEVSSRGPVNIYTDEDYDALPSGTVFLPPGGGKPRRKP